MRRGARPTPRTRSLAIARTGFRLFGSCRSWPVRVPSLGRTQMRGPTRLIGSNVVGRLGRARPPAVRGVARGTYALAALLMLLNVLAPMVGTQSAAAAPAVGASTLASGLSAPHPGTPPPFPAPSRVAVVGDFQSAIGC